jgi:hypothetical protein
MTLFTALLCGCPVGSALTALTASTCPEDFGQVQKIMFQRVYSTGTTLNESVIASANPNVLATWTALKAASDGTKVTVSPFVSEPTFGGGEARNYGGGNATVNGVAQVIGSTPTTFTGKFLSQKQTVIALMKAYMCENLGVYLINGNGKIAGLVDDLTTPTKFRPIPLAPNSFFIGDKIIGGFEAPDHNMIAFGMLENWSDKFYVVTPTDFNGITQL